MPNSRNWPMLYGVQFLSVKCNQRLLRLLPRPLKPTYALRHGARWCITGGKLLRGGCILLLHGRLLVSTAIPCLWLRGKCLGWWWLISLGRNCLWRSKLGLSDHALGLSDHALWLSDHALGLSDHALGLSDHALWLHGWWWRLLT